jgi:hypothetical protein
MTTRSRTGGRLLPLLAGGIAASLGAVGVVRAAEEHTIHADPLPLASIHRVALREPVEVVARGRREKHTRLWLIVTKPIAVPRPPTDAPPPTPMPGLPAFLPILHVDEYRATLVAHDDERGVYAWLVPRRADLKRALVWYLTMSEDSVLFWEPSFWARNPSLDEIARKAVRHPSPGTGRAAPPQGNATYRPAEIDAALAGHTTTLRSMEAVRRSVR